MPLGAVHDGQRRFCALSRASDTIMFPAAELDGVLGGAGLKAKRSTPCNKSRRRRYRNGFSYEWTEAGVPTDAGPVNAEGFAFALGVAFVFLVLAAQLREPDVTDGRSS